MSFKSYKEFRDATVNRKGVSLGSINSATLIAEGKNPTMELAKSIEAEMKAAGIDETRSDVNKAMEIKAAQYGRMETKANEVMHTSNIGFGAELVPGNILSTDFLDVAPAMSPLLGLFQAGYHGNNLPMNYDVAAIGEIGLHKLVTEWTTGTAPNQILQGKGIPPTAKVTINQKERWFTVDVAEHEVRFATVVDILTMIKTKLAISAGNTIVSDIINGDTATALNTNINIIDGTPAADDSFLAADGLVKSAFTNSTAYDAGTYDFSDYLTLLKALGTNATNREDTIFLHSMGAEVSALGLAEFKQAYLNGEASTALTGKLPKFLSANYATDRWLKDANAAGKVSGTASNNTKGRILYCTKYAVQHGSNGEYLIEIFRVPGKGYQIIGYYFYGHAIASKLAGDDNTTALLYNIS